MTDLEKERIEVSQRYDKLSPLNTLLFNAVIECGLAIANDESGSSSIFLSLIAAAMKVNNLQQNKKRCNK